MLLCATGNAAGQSAQPAAGQSAAQEAVRAFDIPAQSLAGALSAFNRQTGIQVTQASGAASRSLTVNAVRGRMTPQQALSRMLGGTGISWQFTGNDAVVVGSRQTIANGAAPQGDGATILDTITVAGKGARNAASGSGFQGTPDWVYETPASVSVVSQQAIKSSAVRNTRDLLDNVAGVTTNRSEGQNPGVSVNVRGLQDQNRVVSMIDGARQNFQRGAHGSTERVFVDTAFIRSVEVEKSGTSGAGGAGVLGGSVNFRSIVADDLIREGEKIGGELDVTSGSNAYKFYGSGSAALRISDGFSVLAGVSRKKLGEYKVGKNGEITTYSGTDQGDGLLFTGSDTISSILKAEMEPTDNSKLTLSWMRNEFESSQGIYQDALGGVIFKREDAQKTTNNTLTSNFHWDPETDLIDFKANLWYNHLKNAEKRGGRSVETVAELTPIDYSMASFGGTLENTSRFDVPFGSLSLNYGVEAFRDNAETKTPDNFFDPTTGVDLGYGYKGLNPSGRRDVVSGFSNATFEHDDWLVASAGLRYDHYGLSGSTLLSGYPVTVTERYCRIYFPDGRCRVWTTTTTTTYPAEQIGVDISDGAFLPTAMVAVKPFEWLQPFAKYSRSFRPPTIMEALISGGHPGGLNYENAPNPYLGPERAETWEIGANVKSDGLFLDNDSLRLKAVYFNRRVQDYIGLGRIYRPETNFQYDTYVNLNGLTKMQGLEIEANYDAGHFYIGGSFTRLQTDFAKTFTFAYNGVETLSRPSVVFAPPESKVTIDGGIRAFEENLTLGARMTHVGASVPPYGMLAGSYATKQYNLVDAYGSYKFNPQTTLRFAVNNVTDVAYVPALGEFALPAPGRTFTASLNFKF